MNTKAHPKRRFQVIAPQHLMPNGEMTCLTHSQIDQLKNSPTQVKPDTASIRSVTSDNALAAMEYEKTKEDLNARRLDKILQNGLAGGNIEMERSVESQKRLQ